MTTRNPLSLNLAGLFLRNEGSETTTAHAVDANTARFSGGYAPTWNPLDPSIQFNGNASGNSYLDAGTDSAFDQLTPGKMTIVAKVWVDRYTTGGIAEKNNGGYGDSGFAFGMDSGGTLRLAVLDSYSQYYSLGYAV